MLIISYEIDIKKMKGKMEIFDYVSQRCIIFAGLYVNIGNFLMGHYILISHSVNDWLLQLDKALDN